MAWIDVFNGDADGICSLVQLRLAEPGQSELVTGIKRDIHLLRCIQPEPGDRVTVLDISMQKNHADLQRILTAGARVFYADHHYPGEIVQHPGLEAYIDTSPTTCTALIVDRYLQGRFRLWAITAAFGDNLTGIARKLAAELGLDNHKTALLQRLGVCLNYNGYGASLADLFFHPAKLYQACVRYHSPFDFISQNARLLRQLQAGYQSDMAMARRQQPFYQTAVVAAFKLPSEAWARRVGGVYGNQLSNENPERAHVIMTEKEDGDYQVSIRAPLAQPEGADEIAACFRTGGGRKAAAGINALKVSDIPLLLEAVEQRYG